MGIGRLAMDEGDAISNICIVQGAALQFCSLAGFLWILVLVNLLSCSVKGDYDLNVPVSTARLLPRVLSVVLLASASCIVVFACDGFGPAMLWCWVSHPGLGLAVYYGPIMVIWILAIARLLATWRIIRHRPKDTQNRHADHTDSEQVKYDCPVSTMESQTRRQLSGMTLVFVTFSLFGLVNRSVCFIADHVASQDTAMCEQPRWMAAVLLQCYTMPLQGLVNSIILCMGLRQNLMLKECYSRQLYRLGLLQQRPLPLAEKSARRNGLETLEQPPVMDHEATIFAATWNVGEQERPPSKEIFQQWLPQGRDAYLIGLQECLVPHAFARAFHEALGGTSAYRLIVEERIGSAQTALGCKGYIVLLVFLSSAAAESRAWSRAQVKKTTINLGTKIGAGKMVARAPNKGAVGATFHFHSTTFKVVAAHMAADKRGSTTSSSGQRIRDARTLLENLKLDYDLCGYDLHLSCHHVILLGDLNFRVVLKPGDAVDYLSKGDLESLLDKDELHGALRDGLVFHGFREAAKVTFLPTYRRAAGEAGRFTREELAAGERLKLHAERLEQLYTTMLADGTERTPSYTDRVLLHSLSDMKPSLMCTCYNSHEELALSDHRPVSADLTLYSIPRLNNFGCCELLLRALRFEARVHTKPQGQSSTQSWDTSCLLRQASKLRRISVGTNSSNISAGANGVQTLQVMMPLPCERRNLALDYINSLSSVVWGCEHVRPTSSSKAALFDWESEASSMEGITISATSLNAAYVHAAIKLLSEGGEELGQGVMAMAPPWRQWPRDFSSFSETPWADRQLRAFSLELSTQGLPVGVLHGVCSARWSEQSA